MMSLRDGKLERMFWPNETVQLLGQIQEYKGKQALYKRQLPEILKVLKDTAIVQSTESANRIEGIVVSTQKISSIVQHKSLPQNPSEAEIAGYHDVLSLIHSSAEYLQISSDVILQLHRDLMQPVTGSGGTFKAADQEMMPTGERPAWQTPEAIDELVSFYKQIRDQGSVNDLLLIGAFILDFLWLQPFADGNGQLARLLTLLLLYQTGYEVGRYMSIEKVIEETGDQYYETLYRSSLGWHEGKHDLLPWINYFLLKAYEKFADKLGITTDQTRPKGWKALKVHETVENMVTDFTFMDVQERCPGISRPTIQRILNELSQKGLIECVERGRNACWRRV